MTIQYAILGLLSWKPCSGYELKKIFNDSSLLYWSGSNNQIYITLLKLNQEKLVTQEVIGHEYLPAKKLYTITPKGLSALKKWILSNPEAPEIRNTFLIQLAWSHVLSREQIVNLINRYEEELYNSLLIEREKAKRAVNIPNRSKREAFIWKMIEKNIESFYENEIKWLTLLKKGLPNE